MAKSFGGPSGLQPGKQGPPAKSVGAFIDSLKSELGKPYVTGGTGPSGFDCSGLVYAALKAIGYPNPPRTSEEQWAWSQHINKSQLKPGDLVFSQWPGDDASPGHVQVYLGGGKVIQAPEPGQKVDIISLASDGAHITGYGRVPGMNPLNQQGWVGGGPIGGQLAGLLGEAGSLLHGVAEVLDWVFGFFAPGQGWRIAFGALAVGSGYGAVKTYTANDTGSIGGSNFPLAVGLAGVASLAAFMAFRPWPQQSGGSEKPGAYIAGILSGQPPPAGPARVHETGAIEAGLAVFATAYLASKAAQGISGIIGGVSGFITGLAQSGAGEDV
jgi:hypothetical protein